MANILIVGEYSGFSLNLAAGLNRIGQKAVVLSYGDGMKKLTSDYCFPFSNIRFFNLNIKKSWIIKSLYQSIRFKFFNKKAFDIVILMNEEFIKFPWEFWLPYLSVKDLKGKSIYLLACGDSYIYRKYLSDLDKQAHSNVLSERRHRTYKKRYLNIENIIRGVIPIAYDYYLGYKNFNSKKYKLFSPVALPIDTGNYNFNNFIKEKIVIFHGYRGVSKGSDVIVKAMKKMASRYSDEIEIVIGQEMPFHEYIKTLERVNIVIDQCRSYGYGMNATICLAMGKIVLSGNEPENKEIFDSNDNPVINIRFDEDMIACELEKLIKNKDELPSLARKSFEFARKIHECKIIAQKYMNIIMEKDET
jgi:hypothetical protein